MIFGKNIATKLLILRRKISSERTTAIALALASLAVLAFAPLAQAETEPNDTLLQANGPLSAQTYTGEIGSETDVDWYWLQLGSQQQITFTATVLNPSSCDTAPNFFLLNYFGDGKYWGPLKELHPSTEKGGNPTASVSWTTPVGPSTYYVKVAAGYSYSAGCQYSFSITPASAYAPAPNYGPVVQVTKGSTDKQPYGPLKNNLIYQGQFGPTSNLEYMWVNVAAGSAQEMVVTNGTCDDLEAQVYLAHQENTGKLPVRATGGSEGNYRVTLPVETIWPTNYRIVLKGEHNCIWQVRFPGSGLVDVNGERSTPLTCDAAKKQLKKARKAEKRAAKAVHSIHGYRAHAKAQSRLEARRRAVRSAKHQTTRLCSHS